MGLENHRTMCFLLSWRQEESLSIAFCLEKLLLIAYQQPCSLPREAELCLERIHPLPHCHLPQKKVLNAHASFRYWFRQDCVEEGFWWDEVLLESLFCSVLCVWCGLCMCVVYVHISVWLHGGQRRTIDVSSTLYHFLPWSINMDSAIEHGAQHWSSKLVAQMSQKPFCLCPTQCWHYRNMCSHGWLFFM